MVFERDEKRKRTVQIASRVTEEEKEELDEICKENDLSISSLIREAIYYYLEDVLGES